MLDAVNDFLRLVFWLTSTLNHVKGIKYFLTSALIPRHLGMGEALDDTLLKLQGCAIDYSLVCSVCFYLSFFIDESSSIAESLCLY